MRYLLDTHVLLWWLGDHSALNADARSAISERLNMVYVSAVSLWEIVVKQTLGKLHLPANWFDVLVEEPFRRLPVSWEHALGVARLPDIHKDPFDRLLLAQCLDEDLTLVTHDSTLQQYGVPVLMT